ncbi:hypothetical protein LTR36_007195 [Oleoguttula mirabilis]|uniref:DUF7587 domain-containing protein n=1 Tax=Oleoguttula mirabilis TaxID=1507867 RepID=A0AAV9JB27_9PEZI|nr:hypothetical protein LTR36_007195 [Oleoguttula mirabilis]
MDKAQVKSVEKTLAQPRFLFRAASDRSRGGPSGNSIHLINPLAGYSAMDDGTYYDRFTAMAWDQADMMLLLHFQYNYKFPSAFSSWSVSLLWVLMHAARKAEIDREENVLIYVLDTSEMSGGLRTYHAQQLVHLFQLQERHDQSSLEQYALGEYLVYGKLRSSDGFMSVRFETLKDAGLLVEGIRKLDPEPRWDDGLHQRIHKLRNIYYHPRHLTLPSIVLHPPEDWILRDDGTEIWLLPRKYFAILRRLGKCFGDVWEATMTLAFASLRRRDIWSDGMGNLLSELDGLQYHRPIARVVVRDQIEEHSQFVRMLELFHEAQGE